MSEIKNLIKASSYLSTYQYNWAKVAMFIIIMFLMIVNIIIGSSAVQKPDSSVIVSSFINMLFLINMNIIVFGNIIRSRNSMNIKNDFVQLGIYMPVKKSSIAKYRFTMITLFMLPAYIVLLADNIAHYLKNSKGVAGYIGFSTIVLVCIFIFICLTSGYNLFINLKSRAFFMINLFTALILFIIPLIPVLFPIALNDDNLYYGMLGKNMVGMFRALEPLAGPVGIIIVLCTIAIGYVLACVIPVRVANKRGWSV
jgi:hypothetical protein